jgi:hypothetical protein
VDHSDDYCYYCYYYYYYYYYHHHYYYWRLRRDLAQCKIRGDRESARGRWGGPGTH